MTDKKKPRTAGTGTASSPAFISGDHTAPTVSGQCAQVLELIRQHQPILSFVLTADHAIPETAARVHNLRAKGFNIVTTILPSVEFRGEIRHNVALYSLGVPEWTEQQLLGETHVREVAA